MLGRMCGVRSVNSSRFAWRMFLRENEGAQIWATLLRGNNGAEI